MARILNQNLFSWEQVEASSDLLRLQLVLEHLPDEEIVAELERSRGNGRNDYPVRPTWNAILAGIVFQHPSAESLLRELHRNAELRQLCGFNLLRGTSAVPSPFAFSRFLSNVIEQESLILEVFDRLVETLKQLLPDFGQHLAFDGKAIPSFSTGRRDQHTGKTSDPDADWGVKTYSGVNADGKAWEKVSSWFGYQLDLIVDAAYELPVAFEVMPASTSEASRLVPMVNNLEKRHPKIIAECTDLSADRGLDAARINETLWEMYGIKPVIDTRQLWKDEKNEQAYEPGQQITRPLHPDQSDNIVFTERGQVLCVCPLSGEMTPMAFRGFEADRRVLGYRCPAAQYGAHCPGREQCEQQSLGRPTDYGRVVRVSLDEDRRVFTPIPRDTPTWQRLYSMRTSVERVNGRLDQSFGFEQHTIRGLKKMRAKVGLALIVMLTMAIGFIHRNRPDLMRSLVGGTRSYRAAA